MPYNNYIPGTCNIGGEQLKKRNRFALKCILATLICILFLQVFHFDTVWRLVMFIPFTLSAIAIQQVYFKFCYLFGIKGFYGFGEIGKTKSIQEKEFLKLDNAKALRMIITSMLIGLVMTILYFFLPF